MSLVPLRAAGLVLAAGFLVSACSAPGPVAAKAPASLEEVAQQSLAVIDGTLSLPGLKAPVEIIRDQQGIPHIFAKNDDDLFFAQGYVMAQDRLWQLEMWRRWHEGRLAEVFGPNTSASRPSRQRRHISSCHRRSCAMTYPCAKNRSSSFCA